MTFTGFMFSRCPLRGMENPNTNGLCRCKPCSLAPRGRRPFGGNYRHAPARQKTLQCRHVTVIALGSSTGNTLKIMPLTPAFGRLHRPCSGQRQIMMRKECRNKFLRDCRFRPSRAVAAECRHKADDTLKHRINAQGNRGAPPIKVCGGADQRKMRWLKYRRSFIHRHAGIAILKQQASRVAINRS